MRKRIRELIEVCGEESFVTLWQLPLALVFKIIVMIFAFGIKVPTGLFIPSLCI